MTIGYYCAIYMENSEGPFNPQAMSSSGHPTSVKDLLPLPWRGRIADLRGRGIYSDFADEFHCIFIHIPRTAGTSVARTLFGRGSRHVPWFEYQRANPRKFRRYFKFAFVRNPWDRLVSTYFFLKGGGLNEMDRAWADTHLAGYASFEEFVMGWLTEERSWSWVHFKPQHYFICDGELRIQVDFVGRMERVSTDFQTVADRLGCKRPLATGNRSRHRHYLTYYTPELLKKVAQVYAADVRLFGYSFDVAPEATPTGIEGRSLY